MQCSQTNGIRWERKSHYFMARCPDGSDWEHAEASDNDIRENQSEMMRHRALSVATSCSFHAENDCRWNAAKDYLAITPRQPHCMGITRPIETQFCRKSSLRAQCEEQNKLCVLNKYIPAPVLTLLRDIICPWLKLQRKNGEREKKKNPTFALKLKNEVPKYSWNLPQRILAFVFLFSCKHVPPLKMWLPLCL